MAQSATKFFEHLGGPQPLLYSRLTFRSARFGRLRAAIRRILTQLRDDGLEDDERYAPLRGKLFEWLTTPIIFDTSLASDLETLCDPDEIEGRWGADLAPEFLDAVDCARNLGAAENPLRFRLNDVLTTLAAEGEDFRIYCHRSAIVHFRTLPCANLAGLNRRGLFICTLNEYVSQSPFATLVKVGPLRARGWGRIPDSVLSAPRQRQLVVLHWEGCNDDPHFGQDPAASLPHADFEPYQWTMSTELCGDGSEDEGPLPVEEDDLATFATHEQQMARVTRAVLAVLPGDSGILFPEGGRLLVYEPQERAACLIVAGEKLAEGQYIVFPQQADDAAGEAQFTLSGYGAYWKQVLAERFESSPQSLLKELRAAGLRLKGLRAAVERWIAPSHTVVPAPKSPEHFRALMTALGLGQRVERNIPFWKVAWREVQRSRGAAITAGVQEQEQLYDLARNVINISRSSIDVRLNESDFEIPIPKGFKTRGMLRFVRVIAVESDYRVPDNELRRIDDLSEFETWRA